MGYLKQSMRLFAVALSVGLIFGAAVCSGSSDAKAEECAQAYELIDGQQSPCRGIVWPKLWTVRALQCVEADLPEAKQTIEASQRLIQSCGDSLIEIQDAHRKALDDLEEIARNAAGLNVRPWYEHPALWLGLGLAGGAGLVVFAGKL